MRRPAGAFRRAPLRVRLVAGFAVAMLVVLTAAGAFVYWRVQFALDRSLSNDLSAQSSALRSALDRAGPAQAVEELAAGSALAQVVDEHGAVQAATPDAGRAPLLSQDRLAVARTRTVTLDTGSLLLDRRRRLRIVGFSAGPGSRWVAVVAVRLAGRDEALRELLAQLAVANLAALAVASVVGYRLARAALDPVEQYRTRAEQIAAGTSGVRLDVPDDRRDEVTRLGDTLNRMLDAQERLTAQQRQFLADASHELRTPLTVLTSQVELALRRPRTASEYESVLRALADDTARLVTLAEQLLDLERAELSTPTAPAVLSAPDVAAAVRRAVLRGRAGLDGTGRSVTSSTSSAPVRATDSQLDQVLGNLVDNAVVHGDGDVGVVLDVAPVPGAGAAAAVVRASVTDGGAGIPAEFLPYAVDRFRRADGARSRAGSGLGLAVVHTTVDHLGGELRICTRSAHHAFAPRRFEDVDCPTHGPGTTVTVLLPAATAEAPAAG